MMLPAINWYGERRKGRDIRSTDDKYATLTMTSLSLSTKSETTTNNKEKSTPYGTASRLLVRGKINLPTVEHPKFEGHVTPNEDEYQKSVQLTFSYCLGDKVKWHLCDPINPKNYTFTRGDQNITVFSRPYLVRSRYCYSVASVVCL